MRRYLSVWLIAVVALTAAIAMAETNILREGLLGAGAGAIGGAASGGDSGDLWKGALAGAGVNIVGGALLDSISGEKVDKVERVDSMNSQDAYAQGYQAGYGNGYKQGYTEGYKEGLKETLKDEINN